MRIFLERSYSILTPVTLTILKTSYDVLNITVKLKKIHRIKHIYI